MPPTLSIDLLKLNPEKNRDLPLPCYMTASSAGMDIFAALDADLVLEPGRIGLVPTGFAMALPEGFELSEGMSYNKYFPGHQIAMAQPIPDEGGVEYQDNAGATSSLKQNAEDVTAFLAWAADPSLNQRKQLGWSALIYLLITTLLLYFAKKRIWARVKH